MMKKIISLLLAMTLCFSMGVFLSGCGSSEEPAEPEQEEVVEEPVTEEPEEVVEEEVQEEPEESAPADRYEEYAQYLSDFKVLDGNGYQVTVDSSIKGDFNALKNCALYTMKKAYEELGTTDMGVFGYFDDYEQAFAYDSNWGGTVAMYKDNESPKSWKWEMMSSDYKYIYGDE